MSQVTISASDIYSYHGTQTPSELRLYANQDFTSSEDIFIAQSRSSAPFYQSIPVTLIGTTVRTTSTAGIYTTTDSNNPNVTYTGKLFAGNKELATIYQNLKIPPTPSTTIFADLAAYSATLTQPYRPHQYYDVDDINRLLDGLGTAPLASDVVIGRSRLSRAPVLVNDPIAVGDNDERLDDDLQRYASLAAAITAIGATPTILNISTTYSHSSGLATIPSTLYLRFKNEARIKGEGGTIAFQGLGVLNTDTRIPYFEGFTAGQVTWTGSVYPKVISTEIFYTGDESLTDRINFVDQATQNKKVTIKAYDRTITGSATVSTYHDLYMEGEFPNTCATWGGTSQAPFRLKNHSRMIGAPGNTVYESNVVNNEYIVYSHNVGEAGGVGAGIYGPSDDIQVIGINFKSTDDTLLGVNNHSTVYFGNTSNAVIENCSFYRTRGYSIIFGGLGRDGYHCNGGSAFNNRFYEVGTQTVSVTNGQNIVISHNDIDARNSVGTSTFTIIDLEPNIDMDVIDNIVVENNFLNVDDPNGFSKTIYGIAAQAASGTGQNIVIRNNTVFGCSVLPVPADFSPLGGGISMTGILEGYIYGNTVRSGFQATITVSNSRGVRIFNNAGYQVTDTSGDGNQIYLVGLAESSIHDNTLDSSPFGLIQRNGIYETEGQTTATASASTITILSNTLLAMPFWVGLNVFYNGTEYEVATRTSNLVFTTTVAVGTVAAKTFTNANVTTGVGTSNIAITSHGFLTGARVRPTGSDLPAPLTGADVYVIKIDANNIQLATTLDLANAGTEIDFTDTGSGTSTLTPVLTTRFSSNKYWANDADFGIRLEPTGTSVIYSTARDVTYGLTATPTELNQLNDASTYQETIAAAGALSVTKVVSKLALSGAGAVTLAVPDASMLGQQKMIEMTVDNGDVTLALTNIEGGTAATTATFSAVGQKLILMGGVSKWTVIKEMGVVLT